MRYPVFLLSWTFRLLPGTLITNFLDLCPTELNINQCTLLPLCRQTGIFSSCPQHELTVFLTFLLQWHVVMLVRFVLKQCANALALR